jgi:N-methylhydantoinase A
VHEFKKGSGFPTKIPVIDMIEIGAGGGSLAGIDERGTLRVGPRSAGAEPGPVCYGRGGRNPTLTDANLVLGYLSAQSFLGGRMALDVAGAGDAIADTIARPLGVAPERAAWGIHEVINEDVARAFRMHASERGLDCRNGSVVVFGGSGPLHGARVARKLRIPRVVCPAGAGVLSAFGLLVSPISFETLRSSRIGLDALSYAAYADMRHALAEQSLGFLVRTGLAREEVRFVYKLDMRYVGQGYEIEVPIPASIGEATLVDDLTACFSAAYEQVFGMHLQGRPIEIVNWKVEASGPSPADIDFRILAANSEAPKLKGARPAFFPEVGGFVECPVYNRYALLTGDRITGPALIEENESTCVLPPGDVLTVDRRGNLVIDIKG